MGRVRFAAFLALVMVAAALVVAAPPLVSPASAQTSCSAGTFAELDACVVMYSGAAAGTMTTIDVTANITYTATLTDINNATDATLEIDGNGFTLDVDGATSGASDAFIVFAGDLMLHHATITGANLNSSSSGLSVSGSASANVSASTFTGNSYGLFAGSSVDAVVTNTTFVGNTHGIVVGIGQSVVLAQSTIVGNTGNGIENSGAASVITGSLIAGNGAGDCNGGGTTGSSGNVVGDASCGAPATAGIAGTYGSLADNPPCVTGTDCTQTIALLPGSPAIDANSGCAAGEVDQRGVARAAGACDAGAFEAPCATSFTVSDETALSGALACYTVAATGETVDVTLNASFALTSTAFFGNAATPTPAKLLIDGDGFTITGPSNDGLVQFLGDSEFHNLTIMGTRLNAIIFQAGEGLVQSSTLHDNGYGVYVERLGPVSVSIVDSTIFDNNTEGIDTDDFEVGDSLTILRSTITGNEGAGVNLRGGGAIEISGSLIAGNNSGGDQCESGANPTGSGNAISGDSCFGVDSGTDGLGGTFEGALAENGCTPAGQCTQTIALLPGSPAVDVNTNCASVDDQRGVARTPGKCDAGSFELGDCSTSSMVGTEDELVFALGCFHDAAAGTPDVTIALTADIVLLETVAALNDDYQDGVPGSPKLVIDGGGFGLLADGTNPPTIGIQLISEVDVVDLTVDGFKDIGVFAEGKVLLSGVTVSNNGGVGVYYFQASLLPSLRVENSTVAKNGAGLSVGSPSLEFELVQSSVVSNQSVAPTGFGTGGLVNQFGGAFTGVATLEGSLIAGNAGPECSAGFVFTDNGGNVIEDTSCVGGSTAGLAGTFGVLADNGCVSASCTWTVALLAGSPAIDANSGCVAGVDQRGFARAAAKCDAGAFEAGDLDADGDGFEGPLGDGTDCDDTHSGVNPAATDIPGNGIDEDCDGSDAPLTGTCNGLAVTVFIELGQSPTEGPDVILGTSGDDTINALGGDDTICAGPGDDTVDAGDGDDWVSGGSGLDVIVGGDGDDTLKGGPDRDIIRGNPGEDKIDGDGGNDRLLGGIDSDTINGGEGDDYLGGFGGGDILNGGPGNETIFGGFGADTIDGGPGDDEIFGLIGNDIIFGGPGNDRLDGNRGHDAIRGSDGNDVIFGGNGDDILNGNAGDDNINGGRADDTMSGGSGIDVCTGNKQNVADTADSTCETIFGVP